MPTQQILTHDNSRIKTYKKCPREFYLSHILHWTPIGDAPPLVFGGAFHESMAAIFESKESVPFEELLPIAMAAFYTEWEKRDGPMDADTQDMWFPRIPTVAETMLHNWLTRYKRWLSEIKVLEIEEPFAVPLFSKYQCPYCLHENDEKYYQDYTICAMCGKPLTEVMLIGRRDLVYSLHGKIYCMDTKTSSMYAKIGSFQNSFVSSFHIDSQIDGYYYTTILTHGSCEAVVINACCTKKDRWDVFEMYHQHRDFDSLYAWYSDTCIYVNRLLCDVEKGPYMFTKNPESCQSQYGFCKFHDTCRVIHNPADELAQPMGFKIEKWEPFDEEQLQALILKTQKAERTRLEKP